MKFLFFTDSHLRDFGSFAPFNKIEENGLSRELNNIIDGFEFVAHIIHREKPHVVMMCGDLFHTPMGVTTTTLHGASIALDKVRMACNTYHAGFFIIPGNHDCQNENLKIYSTSILNNSSIEVITEDKILELGDWDGDHASVGVIQFTSDYKHAVDKLHEFSRQVDFIVTHLDFEGCNYENGFPSESLIPSAWPVPVISGDIHYHQQVGAVTYIGSLIQNRFSRSDLNGVGGVLVYNTVSKKQTFYPNKHSYHYVKIESPSDIKALDPDFNVVLQVKCPIDDFSILDGYEYVYMPILKPKEVTGASQVKVLSDSPYSTLKKFVSEHNPDAVEVLDKVVRG